MTSRWLPARRAPAALKRLGGRSRDAGGRDGKRQPATPAAPQFAPRRTTAQEATGRVMTQLTLIESALQRAAVVSEPPPGGGAGCGGRMRRAGRCIGPFVGGGGRHRSLRGNRQRAYRGAARRQRCRTAYTDMRPAVHDTCRAPVSRSAGDARAREVRTRGIARPPARVRGVALGRLDGCRRPFPHYYRRAQRARRCRKPGRPRTLREQLHFAETISRYLTRPALPDPVNEVLAPFVKRIAEKHDRESAEGRCAHKVSELRVEATPDIDHESRRSTYS